MAAKKREPDPPAQLDALARALAGAAPPRLVLLRGEERYFREQGIELVRRRCEELGHELAAHAAKGPDFDLALLLGDLAGGSLFAAARCVVVRDADSLLPKAGKDPSPFVRAALAFLDGDLPGTLVVSADSVRADHALAKRAAEAGVVVGCRRLWDSPPPWNPDPRQAELVLWFARRARERSVRLAPEQALYVVAATGNDLFDLESQLDKLAAGGEHTVRELVGWSAGGSPFEVADAIVDGDLRRAAGGIQALFRGGFQERDGTRLLDPAGLGAIVLGSLARGVRQALAGSEGEDPVAAAGRAGWTLAPTKRAAFAERVRKRRRDQWRRMLDDVARLEHASRTGGTAGADELALLALRWRAAEPARGRRR